MRRRKGGKEVKGIGHGRHPKLFACLHSDNYCCVRDPTIDILPALNTRLLPTVQAISHLADIKVDVQLKPHSFVSFPPLHPTPDPPGLLIVTRSSRRSLSTESRTFTTLSRSRPQIQFLLWMVPQEVAALVSGDNVPCGR